MSRENLEVVKRGIDAFNRRDVDAFAKVTTVDFEMFPALARIVEGGSYRGREVRIFGDEFRDLGGRVLVLGRLGGRGKGSGVPVNARLGTVNDFRDGKMSRVRTYLDHGQALRAAGLEE
jgi:ketosteroid isomerase-like protein